jgi:archaeosine synthase
MPGVEAVIRFTDMSLSWPEVVRFRTRVRERYYPEGKPDCVVILPCSKGKPYSRSRSHRFFAEAINPAKRRLNLKEIIMTSPLGAVPRALESVPPARNYDIPVTGIWSHEEIAMASESLAGLLLRMSKEPVPVVAHVAGGYLDACRMADEELEWGFSYTGCNKPASIEGIRLLGDSLSAITGSRKRDPLSGERQVLSYQYGQEVSALMTEEPARRGSRRGVRRITRAGSRVARLNPHNGMYIPEVEGSRILCECDSYCVDIDFKPEVKVVYCPGIVGAEASIRPDDEVAVRWKGELVGQGKAAMSGPEMEESSRGKGVVLREIYS